MPADLRVRRPADSQVGGVDGLRSPKAVLWRALLGGVTAGGLLGALVVLPDSLEAQLDLEPEATYAVTWSAFLLAVPIGALVGFLPSLLAVVVWEWQLPRGDRRARVVASVTAALVVVATPCLVSLASPSPGSSLWTTSGLVFLAVAALVSFTIAYLSIPAITTRRQGRRQRRR